MNDDIRRLSDYFAGKGKAAIAFSGGVDSTFLLKVAHDTLDDDCIALTAFSPAIPEKEMKAASDFCRREGIRQIIFEADLFAVEGFAKNAPDRCYHCKKAILSTMNEIAFKEGFVVLAEGSNVDDRSDYRPGSRAVKETGTVSPLDELGFTKQKIRECSRKLGLLTWDQPSHACLASRIPYNEPVTEEKLIMIDRAEDYLSELGFNRLRVRLHGNLARIEVDPDSLGKVLDLRTKIIDGLKKIGFVYVTLDIEGFRSGSLNETLKKGKV